MLPVKVSDLKKERTLAFLCPFLPPYLLLPSYKYYCCVYDAVKVHDSERVATFENTRMSWPSFVLSSLRLSSPSNGSKARLLVAVPSINSTISPPLSLPPSLLSLLGDIVITGHFFPGQQKMWTLVVYADDGLPHHHNFTDETIQSTPTNITLSSSSKSGQKGKKGGEGGDVTAVSYRVVLTIDPSRMPEGRENVVDVSSLPHGAVILRLIYPNSQEVFEQSKPSVKVVQPQKKGGSKKEV